MNPMEQLALGLQSLRFTMLEWARGRLWWPFLLPFALQGALVAAFSFTAHPFLSWLLAPVVARVAGADALHYPELFRRLPELVLRADLFVTLTAGAFATGVGTRLFASAFAARDPDAGSAFAEAWRRLPALLLAQAPAPLLLWLLSAVFERLALVRLSSFTHALLPQLQLVAGVLVQAAFAYVAALVVLGRRSPLEAWRELPSTWGRGLAPAVVALAAATLVLLPLQRLAAQTGPIVSRGVPELVAGTTMVLFAGTLFASWLVTGATTLVWMSALSGSREGRS